MGVYTHNEDIHMKYQKHCILCGSGVCVEKVGILLETGAFVEKSWHSTREW